MPARLKSLVPASLIIGLLLFVGLPRLLGRANHSPTSDVTPRVQNAETQLPACASGQESGLPLPSSFLPDRLPVFQTQLKTFLTSGKYRNLNWCEDKGLRDTGPFINNVSYGVHPVVKIYYSPSVIRWLQRKNPDELIPDGAIIIKEQYSPPPAARYQFQAPPEAKTVPKVTNNAQANRAQLAELRMANIGDVNTRKFMDYGHGK